MGINTLEQLAPWIAIAFTLALSILVPLFTQIANNNFQLKMENQKAEQDRKRFLVEEKRKIYLEFLRNVGACITYANKDRLGTAGASIQQMYLVCPQEWWDDLDEMYTNMRAYEWKEAESKLKKINKLIAKEYSININNNEADQKKYRKKAKSKL